MRMQSGGRYLERNGIAPGTCLSFLSYVLIAAGYGSVNVRILGRSS